MPTKPCGFTLEYGGPAWTGHSLRLFGRVYGLGAESLAVTSLVLNSFRAVTPEAQRKARVIVWGLACGLLPIMALGMTISISGVRFEEIPFWPYAFCVLALFLLPLSFAYAVVKHRVLEIPLLLKRSARYVLVQRGFVLLSFLGSIAAVLVFIAVFTRIFRAHPEKALPAGLALGVVFGVAWTVAGSMLEQQITSALHPRSMAVYFKTQSGGLAAETADSSQWPEEIAADAPVLAKLARRRGPWDVLSEFASGAPCGLQDSQAECLVPILDREGRLIGLIGLGGRLSEERYSSEDKRLLASVASQAGTALENLELAVLGLFERWECAAAEVALHAGDALVLYTDGVTEAESVAGEEFGERRLIETLRSHVTLPASELIETVVAAVRKFSRSEQPMTSPLLSHNVNANG